MNFLTRIFAVIVFSVGLLPSFGQETAPKEVVDKVSAETMAAATKPMGFDQQIDKFFGDYTSGFVNSVCFSVKINGYEVVTFAFQFVNIRSCGLALRTVRGKYSNADDPGEVTHFQALSAAVSGTVGLGNIAGVAIGIKQGGPGVAFWLFLSGFLGMTTKFAECTLGVKYREILPDGRVSGGAMYYLRKGLAERGMGGLGKVLAFFFAIFCIFASFGGGNIFQVNQTTAQRVSVTGGSESVFAQNQWMFGAIMAVMTGLVIIGGIKGIAKVTDKLVPVMCVTYIASCLAVLAVNAGNLGAAFGRIISEAFEPRAAVTGGMLAAFVWGMRRATFSNEAGIGSAPIAHAAAKTRKPASEGVVALLEPFMDTVVICTMTALVLCVTMQFDGDTGNFALNGQNFSLGGKDTSTGFGIQMTSLAFETVHSGFRYVLFACVFLFAFSTLITWSYYGLQAWQFLFGKSKVMEGVYKVIFCLVIVIGSAASMDKAIDFSDASLFAMSIPNLIGVYLLLPVVRREYADFLAHARAVDAGSGK